MRVPEAPVYYGMAVSEANPRQALLNVEDIGITLLDWDIRSFEVV